MTKKALVTWGGWNGHEPEQCAKVADSLLKAEGFETVFTDSMDCYTDSDLMESLDLIVPCWTMDDITGEQSKGLIQTVKKGCGLAGWHGGMGDSFRQNTTYQYMVGGQWVEHPGGIIDYEVNIISKDDAIVAGLSDFKLNSEQYYMHTDPGNEVLVTTTFTGEHDSWIDGTVMPVVWKRHFGEGRVFYSSLGHIATDFDVPEVSEIMKRGMLWACK
jgi:type 1 glutamine amidotransferase